jgi:hypothetical protein
MVAAQWRLADLLEKAEPILPAALPYEPPNLFHPSRPRTNEDMASKHRKP